MDPSERHIHAPSFEDAQDEIRHWKAQAEMWRAGCALGVDNRKDVEAQCAALREALTAVAKCGLGINLFDDWLADKIRAALAADAGKELLTERDTLREKVETLTAEVKEARRLLGGALAELERR